MLQLRIHDVGVKCGSGDYREGDGLLTIVILAIVPNRWAVFLYSEMEFFNVFEYWARNCKIGVYRGINCAFSDLFGQVCRFFIPHCFDTQQEGMDGGCAPGYNGGHMPWRNLAAAF
ncbi:hypothetical protein J9978_02865 [Chromobacterium violaceum]|uniref:hypothetical protein n=1 Tax=Chromobacterium violaceum TaxID=536 RepID=UPI00111C0C9B|nr:hypothetical protein [Chromobacterium violaceum]MBP4048440.1 hypothetical protein [Chromobacterium violaceum]